MVPLTTTRLPSGLLKRKHHVHTQRGRLCFVPRPFCSPSCVPPPPSVLQTFCCVFIFRILLLSPWYLVIFTLSAPAFFLLLLCSKGLQTSWPALLSFEQGQGERVLCGKSRSAASS